MTTYEDSKATPTTFNFTVLVEPVFVDTIRSYTHSACTWTATIQRMDGSVAYKAEGIHDHEDLPRVVGDALGNAINIELREMGLRQLDAESETPPGEVAP